MDNQLIPKWICRLVRDIAAQTAVVLTNPTLRDNTALTAPDTIMDNQPIPAFRCRRFRDLQYRRVLQ